MSRFRAGRVVAATGDRLDGIDLSSQPWFSAGLLAALLERSRTGKGRIVETSLMRTGLWAIGVKLVLAAAVFLVTAGRKDAA